MNKIYIYKNIIIMLALYSGNSYILTSKIKLGVTYECIRDNKTIFKRTGCDT